LGGRGGLGWPQFGLSLFSPVQEDVLFVKRYKSHKGPVSSLEVSAAGDMCASMCLDGTVKVYDVATFDMVVMLRLKFVPGCCAFVSHSRAAQQVLAVSDLNEPKIYTFDVSSGSEEPLKCLDAVHQAPLTCMRLCGPHRVVCPSFHQLFVM
jgi:peptidylprolyl isomerase domain and WD repeat-containing protein 1